MSPIKVAIFPACLLVGCRAISSARGKVRGKKFLPSLLGSIALKTHSSSNQELLIISSLLFKLHMYKNFINRRRVPMELEKISVFITSTVKNVNSRLPNTA